ncbi:MAG: dethiobiotin synthetase [Polyangiales bacterium]|jgi:dethiobiotin synthetase
MQLIVSGTGTGVGKTVVSCALARALAKRGSTKGIKPYETGVDDRAHDAEMLAEAAGQPCVHPYFRAAAPLAPAAFDEVPSIASIADQIRDEVAGVKHAIIESAGGLFVPIAPRRLFADLAAQLGLPIVLVTYDGLGTLSHTLATLEAARTHSLPIMALVLNQGLPADPSREFNHRLLSEHCDLPIVTVSHESDGKIDASAEEILALVD